MNLEISVAGYDDITKYPGLCTVHIDKAWAERVLALLQVMRDAKIDQVQVADNNPIWTLHANIPGTRTLVPGEPFKTYDGAMHISKRWVRWSAETDHLTQWESESVRVHTESIGPLSDLLDLPTVEDRVKTLLALTQRTTY